VLAGPVDGEVGPNLVSNGGFEATASIAGSGWTPSPGLVEGVDYFVDPNPAHAHTGSRSFAGGTVGRLGFISQNIDTVVGQSYNIHLWLANFSGVSTGTRIDVLWGADLVYSAVDITGFGYREIVIDPIATSTFMMLSIGLRDDSQTLNIDDVLVRRVQEVPEPAGRWLFGLGLAALGLFGPGLSGFTRRWRHGGGPSQPAPPARR
jgi:hypothetical protein